MVVDCGTLRVVAEKMIRPLDPDHIGEIRGMDPDGTIRLGMHALLVKSDNRVILMDPGCADFLPSRLQKEYGLQIESPLEDQLERAGVGCGQVTDVIFTHLHFDHGSGAFRRLPGNIVKRFPEARYHVLKEHYTYALKPHPSEAGSFFTPFLKYLDRIHWIEEWDDDRIEFRVFNGHTRGMVVPLIRTPGRDTCFVSDLVPMEVFLQAGVCSGYDLEPGLADREKQEFLKGLDEQTTLIFFHDPLKECVLYP